MYYGGIASRNRPEHYRYLDINMRKAKRTDNFENSGFDLYIDEKTGARLSDGFMNINFVLPGVKDKFSGKISEEIMITVTSNSQSIFYVKDFEKLMGAIEKVKKIILEKQNTKQTEQAQNAIVDNNKIEEAEIENE